MELAAPLLTDTGEGHCTAVRRGVLGCSLSGSTVGRAILWWELCLNRTVFMRAGELWRGKGKKEGKIIAVGLN